MRHPVVGTVAASGRGLRPPSRDLDASLPVSRASLGQGGARCCLPALSWARPGGAGGTFRCSLWTVRAPDCSRTQVAACSQGFLRKFSGVQ